MRDARRAAVLLAGAALLMTVAACSGSEPGHPVATGQGSSAASQGSSSSALPPRPKSVSVDGVSDPCALLSANQRTQLAASEVRNEKANPVKTGDLPTCTLDTAQPFATYSITPISATGVDYWSTVANISRQTVTVGGFPAVQFRFSGTTHVDCSVAVDVADNQQLLVEFVPFDKSYTQDTMCQNAQKAAGFALATLQSGK